MFKSVLRRSAGVVFPLLGLAILGMAVATIKVTYLQTRFSNGLTVYLIPRGTTPLATVAVAVRCGAVDQSRNYAGLFHLYEHMAFEGAEAVDPSKEAAAELIDMGATEYNAYTEGNFTVYHASVPASELDHCLSFWARAMAAPSLDARRLERERRVAGLEIADSYADPDRIAYAALCSSLYPASWRLLSASGSPTVVANAGLAQMVNIRERFYTPSNMALLIGGGVEPGAALDSAQRLFGALPSHAAPL